MGVPTDKRGRGVAGEIALARRESPHRGSRLLGLAKALVNEMPHTMAAMTRGELNEWRATLMVRETAVLERQDRAAVDTELADELPTLSDRQVAARARAIAYRIDPSSALKRGRHATSERYVAIRPAPDTMAIVSAYLPVRDGVACYAALRRHAETLKAGGAERSLSQLMADIFIERLTGRTPAVGPDIEIALIMTDQALFGAGESPTNPATESTGPTPDSPASAPPTSTPPASAHPKPAPPQPAPPKPSSEPAIRPTIADAPEQEPASLVGYGPIPAALAREFIAVRRMATEPLERRRRRGPPRSGFGGFTPIPSPGSSPGWTLNAGCSARRNADSWSTATSTAARPGAAPPSATPTMPRPMPMAAPPASTTAKVFANAATTPRRPPDGPPEPIPIEPSQPRRRAEPPIEAGRPP